MVGTSKESINALITLPIINHPDIARASTSSGCSSCICEDDNEVPPPTPVENFPNRQKIQKRRTNSEEERQYASDDEQSSDDDSSEQYHPERSAKKQDLVKKAKLLKRLQTLGLAPRKHYRNFKIKSTKKRKLRKSTKKSPPKSELPIQVQDPLFPRPKFLQCEFCEKSYIANCLLKRHMAKHLAVRKWSLSSVIPEEYYLHRRNRLDSQRPKIWGMVFKRLSGVM